MEKVNVEAKPKKNIREYLRSNLYFHIPAYQRGYKWGVASDTKESDAKIFVTDLLEAFNKDGQREYFIQGVTGYCENNIFYLIDGQQRTTSLFLLVAILADENSRKELLFNGKELKLQYYGKRCKTSDFLTIFCQNAKVINPADTQDIHFLLKAAKEMQDLLPSEDSVKQAFLAFILDYVYIFQIDIQPTEAPNVFSMMNENKAEMQVGELIKAEYLSGLSRFEDMSHSYTSDSAKETLDILKAQLQSETAIEWKINSSRSRLAREWDKWIYWWANPEIRAFFGCNESDITGWLFPLYCQSENIIYNTNIEERKTVFKIFRERAMGNNKMLKQSFESLRRIQKRIEDIYNNYKLYNLLGFVLCILEANHRLKAIQYFIDQKDVDKLKEYVLYRMADVPHEGAINKINNTATDTDANKTSETIQEFVNIFYGDLYNNSEPKEAAMRYLYFCNVMASDLRKTKFEFLYKEKDKVIPYWRYRSLEHIWPKSRVSQDGSSECVSRHKLDEQKISEHMLGNMVFLHKTDNSTFKARTPYEKRLVYFDLDKRIYSRGMLHTMAAFGGEEWNKDMVNIPSVISNRHNKELSKLQELYGKND